LALVAARGDAEARNELQAIVKTAIAKIDRKENWILPVIVFGNVVLKVCVYDAVGEDNF
jgi:hypothetical protein